MENSDSNSASPLPKIPDQIWSQFTPAIQNRVSTEYVRIRPIGTNDEFRDDENVLWMISALNVLRALSPVLPPERPADHPSWIRENISGLMFITTLLTIAFGILGAWGLSAAGDAKLATSGFLDIAKLCAGALVGAAGAVGVGAAAKK